MNNRHYYKQSRFGNHFILKVTSDKIIRDFNNKLKKLGVPLKVEQDQLFMTEYKKINYCLFINYETDGNYTFYFVPLRLDPELFKGTYLIGKVIKSITSVKFDIKDTLYCKGDDLRHLHPQARLNSLQRLLKENYIKDKTFNFCSFTMTENIEEKTGSTKGVFEIRSTDWPEVFELYLNNQKHGIAYLPKLSDSRFVNGLFTTPQQRVLVKCRLVSDKNKWIPYKHMQATI